MSLASLRATLRALDLRESEDMRIVDAKMNLAKARETVRLELHPQRMTLIEAIGEAQRAKDKATTPLPVVLVRLLRRLSVGVDYPGKLRVTWHDGIPRFVVVSHGGGKSLSGQTQVYGQAGHFLIDLTRDDGTEKHGWKLRGKLVVAPEVAGRLSKAALEAFKAKAETIRAES